jgi:hypothetical protein
MPVREDLIAAIDNIVEKVAASSYSNSAATNDIYENAFGRSVCKPRDSTEQLLGMKTGMKRLSRRSRLEYRRALFIASLIPMLTQQ